MVDGTTILDDDAIDVISVSGYTTIDTALGDDIVRVGSSLSGSFDIPAHAEGPLTVTVQDGSGKTTSHSIQIVDN